MDAAQLTRWTRFAAKGGIGKCTAIQDCVAKEPDDLMFLEDDEITVLMQLPEEDGVFLGYCEGVVGRFDAAYVRFHAKLKTPVITKRASSTSKSPHSRSSTPSHKQPLSQSPAPSLSRVSSRDSAHAPPTPRLRLCPPLLCRNCSRCRTLRLRPTPLGNPHSTIRSSRPL
ncbi:hypothetical protein BC834DRAFT_818545 [Gloeopeniophorella convolvens]|nr:hypothetical protein BC834DRAFT_818545 [Gloeopeniophorella convolvens]